jgi:hypothetical protein
MQLPIEALKADSLRMWQTLPRTLMFNELSYEREDQISKEIELDLLLGDVDTSAFNVGASPGATKRQLISVRSRVQKSIVPMLHSFGCNISNQMQESLSRVTDEFINAAYDFDPSLTEEAVYQASRNVMIMNTFQMHLGKYVALTPSIFAYSLLYPYTDNYLDAADVDTDSKHGANARLDSRLRGISRAPKCASEEIIDRLVGMIEGEYDRILYPRVFQSLLAIHHAQARSVSQQNALTLPRKHELLDISVEKGGTSVLADGFLVAGELSDADMFFFFRFGVVLQLIDDLQDIEEDAAINQRTLVGDAANEHTLEDFTDRLLSFLTLTLSTGCGEGRDLYLLIERSCRLLVLEAIAVNASHYNRAYLEHAERRSPVRFGYLRELRIRLRDGIDKIPIPASVKRADITA